MVSLACVGVLILMVSGSWGASLNERSRRQADDHPFPGTSWTDWMPCTSNCDGGKQTRNNCTSSGPCATTIADCHLMPCSDPFDWSDFDDCNAACGGGQRRREAGSGCTDDRCQLGVVTQSLACHAQSCSEVDGCGIADLVFVLDSSGSVGDLNWHVTKQFVIDVVKGLGLTVGEDLTSVSVVSYSTEVDKQFDLQTYHSIEEIEAATWDTPYSAGSTNTADGIRMMRQIFRGSGRPDIKNIGVVLTDGKSNVLPETTGEQARLAHQEGVSMFAIGVGDGVNEDELREIASDPEETYMYTVADYGALQSITQAIVDETCETATQLTCTEWSGWSSCSVSCGGGGEQMRTRDCVETDSEGNELETSTLDENRVCGTEACPEPTTPPPPTTPAATTTPPTTPAPTTRAPTFPAPTTPEPTTPEPTPTPALPTPEEDDKSELPVAPDCSLCDYGTANVYLRDRDNCRWFYQCARSVISHDPVQYTYTRHHKKCPVGTFFNQDIWNCDHIANANLKCQRQTTMAPAPPAPTTRPGFTRCPLTPVLSDLSKFISGGRVLQCPAGTRFSWLRCACVHAFIINPPTCVDEDGLLLHYTFNEHFNDVTCKNIPSDVYGSPVIRLGGIEGKSAYFNGRSALVVDYMTNFFNGVTLDGFSVALWFKRQGPSTPFAGLVNNGNCDSRPSFSVNVGTNRKSSGLIKTAESLLRTNLPKYRVGHYEWVHVAMVHDGQDLVFFVNGEEMAGSRTAVGTIGNTKCPMQIGHEYNLRGSSKTPEPDNYFFTGYMDELRIYTKALSAADVQALYDLNSN